MIITTIPNIQLEPSHMFSVIRDTIVPFIWFMIFSNYLLSLEYLKSKKFFDSLVLIGLFSVILGLMQHFGGIFRFYNEELDRNYFSILSEGAVSAGIPSTGFFSYFNAYGLFIEMPILYTIVSAYYSVGKERIKYEILSVILLIGMYLSFSRGTYLSFLISFLFILSLGMKKFRFVVYTVGVSIIFIFFQYILPYFLSHQAQIGTLLFRFSIWQTGYDYFSTQSNWIYGMGPGMFMHLTGSLYDVHNEYLMHLFENGLIGFAALIYLVLVLISESYLFFKKAQTNIAKTISLSCVVIFIGYFTQELIEHSFNSIIFRLLIFSIGALLINGKNDDTAWIEKKSLKS